MIMDVVPGRPGHVLPFPARWCRRQSLTMPELPEVETVARDLRGLVVGARIAEVRVNWLKTLRSQDEGAFADAVVGRGIIGTSRGRSSSCSTWTEAPPTTASHRPMTVP